MLGSNTIRDQRGRHPRRLQKIINATLIRHYTRTEIELMEIPDVERSYFYKHMGHSEEINRQTYQSPIEAFEITKVGKNLKKIDQDLLNER